MAEKEQQMSDVLKRLSNFVSPVEKPQEQEDQKKADENEVTKAIALFAFDYGVRFVLQLHEEKADFDNKGAFFGAMMSLLVRVAGSEITLVPEHTAEWSNRVAAVLKDASEEKIAQMFSWARGLEKLICLDYFVQSTGRFKDLTDPPASS